MPGMRIGELGSMAGVSVKTIRYYEEIGLLPAPERTESGYRSYGPESADRLRFIKDSQATGLSLTEIVSILDLRDHGEQKCGHVVELLEHHIGDIESQIGQLRRTKRLLGEMTRRARSLDPSECSDPNRCQTIAVGVDQLPPTARKRLHASGSHGHSHSHSD